ncbi:MAG: histidinol dehydrogenase [Gammaproteobacteria bacterium]|nr:histidinol dehydrogenase [Gammaproteobacteria bacterium]
MTPLPRLLRWSALADGEREAVLARPAAPADPRLESRVRDIMRDVRQHGDAALLRLEAELDGAELDSVEVSGEEIEAAAEQLTSAQRAAIRTALENIRACHAAQRPKDVRVQPAPGIVCEQRHRPLQVVGLYVPAGIAPLPSTALMLAAPAQLADCPLRVLCTPPDRDGRANPAVLHVAQLCEVHQVFKLGGAQAIAAMAYGTESVPRVDKLFGPGSRWVAAAKQQAAMEPGGPAQDLPAGPTEAMVIADAGAQPLFVALDLLSQAEHGEDAHVLLLCLDTGLAEKVQEEIANQLRALPRRDVAEKSLSSGALLIVDSLETAVDVANRYAPEHLLLHVAEPRALLAGISHAGAVFLGPWSPESSGDYCNGANHVLPTYGSARWASGLSLADFHKRISVQELTREGLGSIAEAIATLARLEGLEAHARAAEARRASMTANGAQEQKKHEL